MSTVSRCFLPRLMAGHRRQQQQQRALVTPAFPVINLGLLNEDPVSQALVVDDIARACRDRGFFQVINHGVSKSVMNGALQAAMEFFGLSTEDKEQFASDDIQRPVRYDTSSRDGISKTRSFLKHYAHPLNDWVQFWPMQPPTYREKMGEYAVEIRRVALQLMGAILQSLGLEPSYLREELEAGVQFLGVNGYPQLSRLDDIVGLAPHSDYGFITILLQCSPGLEVMPNNEDAWMAVPEVTEALHVHIGDHLEVLSNGRFKSLLHRAVLNPDGMRVSIASIHGLSMNEKVHCAEELVDEQHPKRYRESSFQDFLDYLFLIQPGAAGAWEGGLRAWHSRSAPMATCDAGEATSDTDTRRTRRSGSRRSLTRYASGGSLAACSAGAANARTASGRDGRGRRAAGDR